MKSRKQDKQRTESPRRERPALTEEFKRQTVQLMHERRAWGGAVIPHRNSPELR